MKQSTPLRFVWSWPDVDIADLAPTMVVMSGEPDGRWYVIFQVDTDEFEPTPATGEATGVDLGVAVAAALCLANASPTAPLAATGAEPGPVSVEQNPPATRLGQPAHGQTQDCLGAPPGAARSSGLLHHTTTNLVCRTDMIAIGDLSVAGRTRSARGTEDQPGVNVRAKAGMNRRVLEAARGQFRRQLEYKTKRAGTRLVVVNRWYPSSKMCFACGTW